MARRTFDRTMRLVALALIAAILPVTVSRSMLAITIVMVVATVMFAVYVVFLATDRGPRE